CILFESCSLHSERWAHHSWNFRRFVFGSSGHFFERNFLSFGRHLLPKKNTGLPFGTRRQSSECFLQLSSKIVLPKKNGGGFAEMLAGFAQKRYRVLWRIIGSRVGNGQSALEATGRKSAIVYQRDAD